MDPQQPPSPRQRLKELLAIPERDRTDEQWDEINELEIQLASAIRQEPPSQGDRNRPQTIPGQPRPAGGPPGKKPFKKFRKKRRGGGGGGGGPPPP